MTDPRIPEDDLRADSFDGLDLDSLTDGVRPTRPQWAAIESAADRRHSGRRPWLISAAAAVVLVLGVAAVVVSRSGTESVGVSTGLGVGAAHWAIPPAEAEVTRIVAMPEVAVVQFTVDGQEYALTQRGDPSGTGVPTSLEQVVQDDLALVRGTTVELPGIGTAYLTCAGVQASPDDPSRPDVATGPSAVSWSSDGWAYHLTGIPYSMEPGGCGLDDPDPSAILALAGSIRYVDDAGWQAFLDEHTAVTDQSTGGVTVPASAPSTTTEPEDAPADRASAEKQIRAAVAAWSRQEGDGSFPNLEDGTEKAAEYEEMFATAARQSGADKAGDGSGNTNTVTSIRFVTPERAAIVMSLTATLPTGTFTFPQDGEAILQDGRWVVTYRTVTSTLRRACIPPGGYDGCPSS